MVTDPPRRPTGSSVAAEYSQLRRALLAAPQDDQAFEAIKVFLLEQRRFLLLAQWLEVRTLSVPIDLASAGFVALANVLISHPLHHGLSRHCCQRALDLNPKHTDARQVLDFLERLPATVPQAQRELRAAAVEERDRRRAAQIYLQIAELIAVYDERADDRLRDNLDRCFLLWAAMPAALEVVALLAQRRLGIAWALDLLQAQAKQTADRSTASGLWVRAARAALQLGSPEALCDAKAHMERALQLDPSRIEAAEALAELALCDGELARAETLLSAAARQSTTDFRAHAGLWLLISDLCHELDRDDDSRAALAEVLRFVGAPFGEVVRRAQVLGDVRLVAEAQRAELAAAASEGEHGDAPVALRVSQLMRLAELQVGEFDQPREGFDTLARALALAPDRADLWAALEALASARGFEVQLLGLYREMVVRADASPELARRLARRSAGDPAGVLGAWRRVLELSPGDPEAAAAVRESLAQGGSERERETALRAELLNVHAEDESGRLRLLRQILAVTKDPQQRSELLGQLLALDPGDEGARRAWLREQLTLGEWAGAEQSARLLLGAALDLKERLAILRSLSAVLGKQGRLIEALPELEEVLCQVPGDEPARRLLETLVERYPETLRATQLLAEAELARGEPARAASLFLREAEIQGDPLLATAALRRAAKLYEETLVDRRSALSALSRALRLDPSLSETRQDLARVARELNAAGEAAEVLIDIAERTQAESDPASTEVAIVSAELAAQLASEARAAALEARAETVLLALKPQDVRTAGAAAERAVRLGKGAEAVKLLLAQADAADAGRQRVSLLLKAAALHLTELNDPLAAAEIYRAAIKEGANAGEVYGPLAEALLQAGRVKEALDALGREVGHWAVRGDPGRAVRVGLRRARLAREGLGDLQLAVDVYRDVLSRRSSEPEALAGLEELLSEGPARRPAALVLAQVYEKNRDLPKFAEALEVVADTEGDVAQRSQLLRRVAQLYQGELRQPTLAFTALARAARLQPRDTQLWDELRALARAHALEPDLAALFEELASRLPRELAGPLLREAAAFAELGAKDLAQAKQLYAQALTAEPEQSEALAGLYRIARLDGDSAAAVEVGERWAAAERNASLRAQVLREVAVLAEALGDGFKAIELWHALLQEEPDDAHAAGELERLSEAYGVVTEKAEALAKKLRQAGDVQTPAGRLLAVRLAQVRRAQADVKGALALLGQVLDLEPGHPEALGLLEEWVSRADGSAQSMGDEAFAMLDNSLHAAGAAPRRVQNLEARLERLQPADRPPYYLVLLELLQNHLQQPQRAFLLACRAFSEDPTQPEVAARLEQLAELTASGDELAALFEDVASRAPLAIARVLRERLAQRAAHRGQAMEAARQWVELLVLDTGEVTAALALDALEQGAPGDLPSLAGVYATALGRLPSGSAPQIPLLRRVALLFDGPLHNPELAAQVYERWVEADPQSVTPLQPLVRIWRAVDNPAQLTHALTRLARLDTTEPKERRDIWLEVAALRERLADQEGAMAAYRDILAVDPQDPEALARFSALLGAAQRWDELVIVLSKRSEQAAGEGARAEATELRLQLAQILDQHLNDLPGALSYYRSVLQVLPDSPKVISGLESILQRAERPEDRSQTAELLEPLYARAHNARGMAQVLLVRADGCPPGPERADLLRRLAGIYLGQLAEPEMAFLTAGRALREDPEAAGAIELAVQAGERAEVFEELGQALEETAPRVREPTAFRTLHWALAQLYQGPLKSLAKAIAEWRKIIEQNPDDQGAFDQLSALYLANNDVASLLEILRRQLAVAEDVGTRQRLMHRIGEIQADRQNDLAQAFATYRRLIELVPDDLLALSRLDGLAVRQQRWPELAPVLDAEVALAQARGDVAAQVGFLERLADLRQGALRDPEGAVVAYAQVLALVPDHARAVLQLEAMLAREPQNAPVAELLEKVHKTGQNWAKVAGTLEVRASAIADPQARRDVWLELAKVHEEKLGRPDLAFMALSRAFRDDPGAPSIRAELERMGGLAETNEELVGVYEEELERQARPDVIAILSLRVGLLYDERLRDSVKALPFLERARELDATVAVPGLPSLERIYRETEAWEKLAEVLDEMSGRTVDAQDRAALLFRLGQLAEERLGSPDRAVLAYEGLRQIDPRHLPGLRSLERLYEQGGRPRELIEVLEQQQALAPEGAARDRLTTRIAEVASSQLGDDERAIKLWGELLQKNPRAEAALNGMEGALERIERWEALAEFLLRRLKATVDPREITRINDKLGTLLGTRLGKPEEAIASFKAVLERDPRNRRALESLRDLHVARGEREEVAGVLRRLIPLQEDATGVKSVRLHLALVLSELGRREEAVEAARRALDLEPHTIDELLRAESLFKALGAFPEVARALEQRAALYPIEQRDEAIAAYFGVAEVFETTLKKPEGGAGALEKVFELDPGNQQAFAALKRIYQKTQDYRRYCALLDKLADQSQTQGQDPAIRVQLLKELASIQEQKLGQKDLAFLALCRAFQTDPLDVSVGMEARRLARETSASEELAEVYLNSIEQIGAAPEAEQVLLALAEIQDQDLDDAPATEESLRRLLGLQPGNARALDALAQLFLRRGRSREYVVALEQKAEQVAGIEEKKQVLAQLAQAYDELLEEPDEAVLTLRRGLELDPADAALTAQLVKLYRREKAYTELVSLLQRAREIATAPAERSKVQLQIAEITEVELKDEEAALTAYHLALELDPQSVPTLQALERLYTKLDRAAELLRIYDRQLDLVPAVDKAKVLFKAAQVWEEKLQNTQNAIACLEGVFSVDPRNTRALHDLARLYRAAGEHERLAHTLQRHISAVQDAPTGHQELVALHVALGGVMHGHLDRSEEAEQLYLRALEIDPTGQAALRALGELYESKQHWSQALEMIRREVRLAASAQAAVDLYSRAGRIQEDQLHDLAEAQTAYRRALEIDPGALVPLGALKRIYEQAENWEGYLDVARQEASVLPEGPEKTERLFELGRFYQETREDTANAERFYRDALKVTPDHLASARPLADIYVAGGDWSAAEAMLDIVVERLQGEDARELCRQHYRLGYVSEKLNHSDKALAAYRRAYELDATYLPALEGLGNLLVRRQQFEEALKIFQAILIHHRDELTDLEVVEIYWQIGEIHRALSQNDRAQKSFEKALEIDPGHEPAHQALAELLEAAGDYEGALEHRQKLLDTLEGDARFDASVQVARLARDRLGDPYQAIDAYGQALKIRPESLAVLGDLLVLYRSTKQGQKAVEVLLRMLDNPEIQADPRGRRDLHYELAQVLRDDVRDELRAVEQFNYALDADPTFVDAFGALEALLSEKQDWPQLEQAYHSMLKRLPKTPETHQARMALWRALGELYHKVLKNPEGAAVAYEVVAKAEPDNGQVAELLADLYAQMPGKEREAIDAERVALKYTADPVKVARTLVRLYASLKDYDKAYVAAQVVVHLLGERSPDEEQIILRLKRYAKEQATRPLTDRLWLDSIYHERLRGPMGEILAICQEASAGAFAVDHQKLNINRKRDKVDVGSSMLFFANMFKYVARTLGMDSLELYKVAGMSGLSLGNTFPVCLVAGEDMFKDRPKRELWFTVGKALAFSRPELSMVRLHPPEEVEAIVQAAVSLAMPNFAITADPALVAEQQRRLSGSLSEAARPALFRAAKEATRDPQSLDLRPYLEAAEHTANRAGVLLSGDVEVAMRCLSQDQGAAARLPLRSKVRDLMLFCMSEPYSKLRASLGLAVEVKIEGRATP